VKESVPRRGDLRARVLGVLALASYGALLWASAPRGPDDWDGIGFVESVTDFDLARFRPHPPGYPVYVALLRLAAVVTRSPMSACVLVAVASAVATVALVTDAIRRATDARTAVAVGVLVGVLPLVWRAGSGVGSEAPALAFAAASLWGLEKGLEEGLEEGLERGLEAARSGRRRGALVIGLAAGLGMGVRLSWAPLYLAVVALTPRGGRRRAWTATAGATLAWGLPLLGLVGPIRLRALYEAQLAGHAQRWGGTVLTEPGWRRVAWLLRDVLVDGVGIDRDFPGLLVFALLVAVTVQGIVAWRRARWAGWKTAVVLVVPYLAWVSLGQNLRDQPRHVLPLAAMLAAGLGLSARGSRRAFALVAALALAVSLRTAMDASARRAIPPAGQQLVDLVRAQAAPDRVDVFGVTSLRFFEGTELAAQALPASTLGEVQVALTRVDRLPARVWLTGEVDASGPSRGARVHVATLCRPARLDRRAPCLEVSEWKLPYLPAE
jgi:hypothetical protein